MRMVRRARAGGAVRGELALIVDVDRRDRRSSSLMLVAPVRWIFSGDDLDRRRAFGVRPLDVRARDLHALELRRLRHSDGTPFLAPNATRRQRASTVLFIFGIEKLLLKK